MLSNSLLVQDENMKILDKNGEVFQNATIYLPVEEIELAKKIGINRQALFRQALKEEIRRRSQEI